MTTAHGTEHETKIKICGLRRLEDAQIVNAVQAQYGGFVFAESKRQVTMTQAQQLREVLLPSVQTVGVFVDATPEEIAALCQQGIINIIQLHGHEDGAYIRQLRALTAAPIVKAVQVRSAETVLQAQQLDCDYLLLDTYIPGVAGGSGRQFDYQQIPTALIKKIKSLIKETNKPFVQVVIPRTSGGSGPRWCLSRGGSPTRRR